MDLPESLKHIGNEVFSSTKITSITLPEGLESIGDNAFAYVSLSNIEFPSTLRKIGKEAFITQDGKLTQIHFPENLQEIGIRAFSNQPIAVVTLPENLKYIGSWAFFYNKSLVTINYNCRDAKVIEDYSSRESPSPFSKSSCDRLNIGENVISIPDNLFCLDYDNDFNITKIDLPESVLSIGAQAFKISSLKSINFPENLESIGASAFYETNIENGNLPTSLKNVGARAFYYTKIKNLTLGENVEYIGHEAFGKISTLENIEYNCRNAKSDYDIYDTQFGPTEFFGSPFYDSNCNSLSIGENVECLPSYYFNGLEGFSEVVLPSGCSFGEGCFYRVSSLSRVVLPEGLKDIPQYAFYNCYNLSEINIPQSVEIIGDDAFNGCYWLGGIGLPISIREIGDRAFAGVPFGTEINLGPNAIRVGDSAFSGCHNVERIFIPRQLEEIGRNAFSTDAQESYGKTVISMIEDPAKDGISKEGIFTKNSHWSLRVPYGMKEVYETTQPWDTFGKYVANGNLDIDLDNGFSANFACLVNQPLDGAVIDHIYYSFDNMYYASAPSYLTLEGSWEISDDSLFDILTPYNYDLTQFFYGIALKLPAGKGHMKIDSENPETSLVVRIADQEPVKFSNQERMSNIVDFNLPEDTFVFIYSENEGKESIIHSITVNKGESGIDEINAPDDDEVSELYYPDGRKASASSKGVLIRKFKNGSCKKVLIVR